MEARLSIAPWDVPPNENNAALARGAAKLGIPSAMIRRNVRGCANLGYCGVGLPDEREAVDARHDDPGRARARRDAGDARARASGSSSNGDRVDGAGMRRHGCERHARRGAHRVTDPRARRSSPPRGAIGTPALLLRSAVPDPHGVIGKRTFLHPTVVSAAIMPQRVDGFAGAPQTVYSDHFLDTLPPDGPIGFKLEAPPVHPILAAITLPGHGDAHAAFMRELRESARADRAASRRLPPGQPRRHRSRCATTARRCSTTR